MEQTAPPGPDANETLRLELYKSLRGEVTLYVEKVPGLWLQKFVLVGGMIAFLIGRHEDIAAAEAGSLLMGAAILAIPVLAALLDAKILEYVLHARAVSRFIARHYESPRVLSDWEAYLWGDASTPEERSLIRLRSRTTMLVTVIPTIALIGLCGTAVGEIAGHRNAWLALTAASSAVYLLVTRLVWTRVWPRIGGNDGAQSPGTSTRSPAGERARMRS